MDRDTEAAVKLLRACPEYIDDARRYARAGNSVAGSVLCLTGQIGARQYAEAAVVRALHVLFREGGRDKLGRSAP